MNFDNDQKPKPKLSTMRHINDVKKLVAAKEDVDLGTVQEENEEDLEQSTQKIKPVKMDQRYTHIGDLHQSDDAFRSSLGKPLATVKDEGEEDVYQLNTGQQREFDNLQSKTIQSRVISDFLRKKELDGEDYEDDNSAPIEEQQKAIITIEGRWLTYMQKMEGRKLRDELKKLPYEVRRSFVKFHDLKRRMAISKNQTDNLSKRI